MSVFLMATWDIRDLDGLCDVTKAFGHKGDDLKIRLFINTKNSKMVIIFFTNKLECNYSGEYFHAP